LVNWKIKEISFNYWWKIKEYIFTQALPVEKFQQQLRRSLGVDVGGKLKSPSCKFIFIYFSKKYFKSRLLISLYSSRYISYHLKKK
jgi:hypothetical protein